MTDEQLSQNLELEQQLLEAKKHVARMKVPVDNTQAKCVDGGYKKNEAEGALAIPGGHLGVSMSLLRLGFTPQEAFSAVYQHVTENGGT